MDPTLDLYNELNQIVQDFVRVHENVSTSMLLQARGVITTIDESLACMWQVGITSEQKEGK